MSYFVYIVECKDKTLYTGSSNDVEKRVISHNNSKIGAKYTKSRRPVRLVYSESFKNKSQAMKRECEIKKLTRKQKVELIEQK